MSFYKSLMKRFEFQYSLAVLAFLLLACSGYLLWWSEYGEFSVFGKLSFLDKWAVFTGIVFLVCILVVIIYSFYRPKKYAWLLLFPTITFCILFKVYESRVVLSQTECDMSICKTITLREDGTYELEISSQVEHSKLKGAYRISSDSIILLKEPAEVLSMEYLKLKEDQSTYRIVYP